MRIISKDKDFYDFGLSYGVDTTVVYERKPIQVNNSSFSPYIRSLLKKNSSYTYFTKSPKRHHALYPRELMVAIGGKLYVFFQLPNYSNKNLSTTLGADKSRYVTFSSEDDMVSYMEENGFTTGKHTFRFNTLVIDNDDAVLQNELLSIGHPVVIFGMSMLPPPALSLLHHNKDTSICDGPYLKDLGISDLLDANVVFNDIMNYIIKLQSPKMQELKNSDKIVKAGFDTIKSFRGKQ